VVVLKYVSHDESYFVEYADGAMAAIHVSEKIPWAISHKASTIRELKAPL
jgi:hypothetical protein